MYNLEKILEKKKIEDSIYCIKQKTVDDNEVVKLWYVDSSCDCVRILLMNKLSTLSHTNLEW